MDQLASAHGKSGAKENAKFEGSKELNNRNNSSLVESGNVSGLKQSKIIQNEKGEFVTIGEIEELPLNNLKGSLY